ncbi:cadherin repeat domain-containing protein, partial [bacterium]|nr:cadherin repeat domain-containing protein [bacterium]
SFAVIATDAAGNASDAQSVALSINNLDDTAPIITSVGLENVDEGIGANQVVYTATADDSADVSDGYTFSLAEGSDDALSINTETGAVTLATNPDYETQSQYSFAVIATDAAGNASEASVTLDINNLDDTAPVITSVGLENVDEGIGANQVVYTATADDSADVSDGYTFSLAEGSDDALSINAETGAVTLATNPDYETQSQYSFVVITTDAAGNASQAQSVTLDINDIDDTAPVIDSATERNHLQNDGTTIYQVTADDPDSSDNEITYSLVPDMVSVSQVGAIEQVYTANEDGSITLQLFIDDSVIADFPDGLTNYDYVVSFNTQEVSIHSYGLTASALNIANDLVDGQLTVAQVHFPINFDIESGPIAQINFNLQPGVYSAEFEISNILLPNNATPDDLIDTVDGVSSVVRYLGNNGLSIDSATGEVSVAEVPTVISQPFYSFTVTATDAAGNQSESQQVTVTVDDKPVITSGDSSVIDENLAVGEVVYQAVASLPSVFSLGAGSDSAVVIDATTGAVTLSESPDFEAGQQEYVFSVIATDKDDSENISDPQIVTITVSNVDEVAPVITSADTVDAIDENSGAEQVIYTATADDSGDEEVATPITYSLTEDSDTGLSIDALTGAVSLTADPDHETQSQYSFAVIATDAAGNASEAQSVTLDINDLDDASPTITSGAPAIAIDENSGAGQVVYTAASTDSGDDIADTPITYSLAEGSDAGLAIDASTGEVTLTTDPDYETQSQYNFSVIATDAAGNASEAQSVTLDINNLDEASPIIS